MSQYRLNLLPSDTGEPLQKIIYGCSIGEIFKQRGNGNAGTTKDPRPAHPIRGTLNGRTGLPITHIQRMLNQIDGATQGCSFCSTDSGGQRAVGGGLLEFALDFSKASPKSPSSPKRLAAWWIDDDAGLGSIANVGKSPTQQDC
jgi:hypothetical protein